MKYLAIFSFLLFIGAGCTGVPSADDGLEATNIQLKSNDDSVNSEEVKESEPNVNTMTEKTYAFPGVLPAEKIHNKQVRITTKNGDVVIKLLDEIAPKTVSNFVYLTEEGYYDGLTFHRVIEDFMVQGGDPTGTGAGGPGYNFEDEFSDEVNFSEPGKLAMANRGHGTNGSQFFITTVPTEWLQGAHTIFGEVIEGQDVVLQIVGGDKMQKVVIEEAK